MRSKVVRDIRILYAQLGVNLSRCHTADTAEAVMQCLYKPLNGNINVIRWLEILY